MREVVVRLHMLQPCLAGIKNPVVPSEQPVVPGQPDASVRLPGPPDREFAHYIFNRDASGVKALMMQENWTRLLMFSCQALNLPFKMSNAVWFDPIVDCPISIFRRYYDPKNQSQYKKHECFQVGSEPVFRAVLKDPVTRDIFSQMMKTGGSYGGLTVFGWGKYGRFQVID